MVLYSHHQQGFTLLEVIVAMVLVATLGLNLFAWINNSLTSIGRTTEHIQHNQAEINALAFLQTLNPMAQPSGEIIFGNQKISWLATPSSALRDSLVTSIEGHSLYRVQLFSISVTVHRGTTLLTTFSTTIAGWQQRQTSSPLPL